MWYAKEACANDDLITYFLKKYVSIYVCIRLSVHMQMHSYMYNIE